MILPRLDRPWAKKESAELGVLCFTNMYPTETEPWAGSFVRELVDGVRALGVRVEVLAFNGRWHRREYAKAAMTLRHALREGSFDLVHAHYGLTGMVALVQRQIPTIVTFHGSDTGNPRVKWQAWVSWVVARRTVPVFVSRDGARRLGCPDAAIIPAGVDIDLFRPRPADVARRSLGWPVRGRFVLLPGARTNPSKDARLFDLAVRELRRVLPDVIAVSLEGFARQQVVDVMSAVDVTLMTSEFEGSPVSAKESLACMTPVVSVPVGDMPELLAGLPGCAIAPRDPVALAEAVLVAFERGGDSALRRRAEQYSCARIAQQTLALYRDVVGRSVA